MAHHHHHVAHMPRNDDIQTVVSIVYVTASATFDGPIGGYVTLQPNLESLTSTVTIESSTTSASEAEQTSTSEVSTPVLHTTTHHVGTPLRHTRTTATTRVTVTAAPPSSSSKTVPIRSQRPGSSSSSTALIDSTSVLGSSSTPTVQSTTFIVSTTAATSSITAAQITSIADLKSLRQHKSMSSGGKAGTTIGVLLALGLIFGLAFLLYRRKKGQNESHQQLDDEKSERKITRNSGASRFSFRQSYIRAPRLSLGPLNHIFPTLSTEKPAPRSNSTDSTNPFGDHAEAIIEEKNHPMLPQNGPSAAAVVPKPLSVKSDRSNSPLPSPGPNGRSGAEQAGPPPSNVHRVQLDFKPSMDDELELRSGQLVRMLHEYDDGWALCIRLDRSQQGVVPRTCISKLPLKPRPAGPAMQARSGHRVSPAGSTSSTSSFGSDESAPHPLSPANSRMRSQTGPRGNGQYNGNGFDNRMRANSASSAVGVSRIIPAGMSPLNPTSTQGGLPLRKPVPGQAL